MVQDAHRVVRHPWFCGALAIAMLVAATWSGCERSAKDQITRARTAYAQNRLEEAKQLFEAALDTEETLVEALVGLVNIHIDRQEIEQAGARLAALDEMELGRREEVLVRQARRRYLLLLYDRYRGSGPASPIDSDRYEEALVGLFNLEGTEQYRTELIAWLAYEARRALAVPDVTSPLDPDSPYIEQARIDQLRAAQLGYQRLIDRDPRVTRVLSLPPDLQAEAEQMTLALDYTIFEREFLIRFELEMLPVLRAEGRFDPATNMIRVELVEPYEGVVPPQEEMEAFRQAVARDLVIDELTTLAYQARGLDRGNNPPLTVGQSVAEVEDAYLGIILDTFEIARNRQVTVQVRAPYSLLVQTAYRLEQYLAWLASRGEALPPEPGTGLGTEQGTGSGADRTEGTGLEANPEPTEEASP